MFSGSFQARRKGLANAGLVKVGGERQQFKDGVSRAWSSKLCGNDGVVLPSSEVAEIYADQKTSFVSSVQFVPAFGTREG